MNSPKVSCTNYVAQGTPKLVVADKAKGDKFKDFYSISVSTDRDLEGTKFLQLSVSPKLFVRAELDKIPPARWNGQGKPVILNATVEHRIGGETEYEVEGKIETHLKDSNSVKAISQGNRIITMEEKLRYGLFDRAQANDLFKPEPKVEAEAE